MWRNSTSENSTHLIHDSRGSDAGLRPPRRTANLPAAVSSSCTMVSRGFGLAAALATVGGAAALDNGFTSPPMGWSALYGAPFNQVNETMLVRAAEGLRASGLAAKGYEYVTIDDWWAVRDPKTGDIMGVPDKFPSGMAAIGKSIHAQGCKFGVCVAHATA